MMKRTVSLFAILTLCIANIASAAQPLEVKPWVYDPDHLGVCQSSWSPKQGLADAGNSNHGLLLTKNAPTAALAASGASVNFSGKLTTLGFDIRNDSHIGAGAPRFNVYTKNGEYDFGSYYGVHTPVPDNPGWTRVRFAIALFATDINSDGIPDGGYPITVANPIATDFDNVTGIDIVFDEGIDQGNGYAVIDNITINTTIVGKPGAAK